MSIESSIFEKYKQVRSVGMGLNTKIFRSALPTDISMGARVLGIKKGKKIILSSEEDMDRFSNFMINDYRKPEGKTLVESYAKMYPNVNADEKEILDAMLLAQASLFKVIGREPENRTVELEDLINPNKKVRLLDIGFSASHLIVNKLLYCHVLPFTEFNMTSGAAMLFSAEKETLLLDKYKNKISKQLVGDEKMKFAAAFFILYRVYGDKNLLYV